MANVTEQENVRLHSSALKMRQRLQSAPGTDSSTLSLHVSHAIVTLQLLNMHPDLSPTRETIEISHGCQDLPHATADWS